MSPGFRERQTVHEGPCSFSERPSSVHSEHLLTSSRHQFCNDRIEVYRCNTHFAELSRVPDGFELEQVVRLRLASAIRHFYASHPFPSSR